MSKKVSDLTKEELGYWVARARGINNVEFEDDSIFIVYGRNDTSTVFGEPITTALGRRVTAEEYRPDTNSGQAMELLKEFNMTIFAPKVIGQDYWVAIFDQGRGKGVEPEEAICRAVIASHYGEEVPNYE